MTPRESKKPPALSEEYVIDSNDDQNAAHSDHIKNHDVGHIPETPSKQKRTAKANEHKKRKTASPPRESSSSSQSREVEGQADEEEVDEDEDEGEPEVADLLDESAKQASSTALSGKEQPRKKSKTTYASLSIKEGSTDSHRPALKRSIAPKQYGPPKDFVRRSATASNSASSSTQFLTNDLVGKEIWYITAPANVSMESIKPFAIRAAMRGEPILNSEGKWYCLKDGPSTNKYILTPNDTDDAYVPGRATISRTFHLREIVNPPAKEKGSEAITSKQMYFEFQSGDELPVRPKRRQPEGLRMRYKPFGTTDALPKKSDAERSNIYIPDQIPLPTADHHTKRKQKPHQSRRSLVPKADSDSMEVDPSQTSSGAQIEPPQSKKSSKNTPSKKVVAETSSARQEKTKKKGKNRDPETAST